MAAVDRLDLRRATLEDAPALLRLLQTAFGRWPAVPIEVTPLEHLEWKMEPPDGLVPNHTVGFLDGEAVAMDLRWMAWVDVFGERVLSNGGAEIAVHPDYQGQGFSTAIRDSEIRRTQRGDLTISTANDQRADRYQRASIFEERLRHWLLPLSLRSRLGAIRASGPRGATGQLAHLVARVRSRGASPPAGYRIESIEAFDERFDRLWEAARADFELLKVRSASYLNWRYADRRSGRTLILGAFEDDQLVGYAVLRRRPASAELLDLFFDRDHRGAAVGLLGAAARELRAADARAVGASLPAGHRYEGVLVAAGFVPAGLGPLARVGRLANAEHELDHERIASRDLRWHVTVGDFEYA